MASAQAAKSVEQEPEDTKKPKYYTKKMIVSCADGLGNELREQEFSIIFDTLMACDGKRKDVAERLGISPRTLRYKLAKMRSAGIEIPV